MPAAPASSLATRALLSLVVLATVMTLLVFGTAGTVRYWQGWLYLAVFFGASLLTTLDLIRRDPALLERRMRGGPTAEHRPAQRRVMLGASVGFISLLVLPALDRRFQWSDVSLGRPGGPGPGTFRGFRDARGRKGSRRCKARSTDSATGPSPRWWPI